MNERPRVSTCSVDFDQVGTLEQLPENLDVRFSNRAESLRVEGWLGEANTKHFGLVPNLFEHQPDYSLAIANVADRVDVSQFREGVNRRPPCWFMRPLIADADDLLTTIEIHFNAAFERSARAFAVKSR
jgi:hypothetical protein